MRQSITHSRSIGNRVAIRYLTDLRAILPKKQEQDVAILVGTKALGFRQGFEGRRFTRSADAFKKGPGLANYGHPGSDSAL